MWELGHKKSWAKNWCFWTVWCWRRLLRVPWTPRRSNQSILKEISPDYSEWTLEELNIERTDAEAEAPILWPPDVKNWLTGKDPDAGKNWRQEEKGMTEAEMVGWHHQLDKTRVWASSGCCWWTGKPRVLQSMGSQRVRHDWATKLILMQSVEQGANEDSGTRGGEGIVSLIMMVVSGENP